MARPPEALEVEVKPPPEPEAEVARVEAQDFGPGRGGSPGSASMGRLVLCARLLMLQNTQTWPGMLVGSWKGAWACLHNPPPHHHAGEGKLE